MISNRTTAPYLARSVPTPDRLGTDPKRSGCLRNPIMYFHEKR
ncbi:MAG: hypothetical protein ACTSWE_09150 [Promethearchaeota archaeon]